MPPLDELTAYLLTRVRLVQENLQSGSAATNDPSLRFADILDSMGMVEFLTIVAKDLGTTPEKVERCVGRRFTTIAALAAHLQAAGLTPGRSKGSISDDESAPASFAPGNTVFKHGEFPPLPTWLGPTVAWLPDLVQSASTLDLALDKPVGWLESHAGIRERRVWGNQDPVAAAADAAHSCVEKAKVPTAAVGALLVTSEAPPILNGLGAAVHAKIGLRRDAVALEIGGACTGFLSAMWFAQRLMPQLSPVLIVSVEAHSRFLEVKPGPAGEAAALFGDAAAASLVSASPAGDGSVPITDLVIGCDGRSAGLVRTERLTTGSMELRFEGSTLARRAVRQMAQSISDLARRHRVVTTESVIVAHGGNGRMPALLARHLGLPREQVWSETWRSGNVGSASLPIAWATRQPIPAGPVFWATVGAGLTWGAAITGLAKSEAGPG